jgi:phosphoglycolate phosphatase
VQTNLGHLAGATIVFDLDGTLVDTAPDLVGTLNALLNEEDVAPLSLAAARPMIGKGARVLIERGFTAAGATLHAERTQGLFDRFIAHYRRRIARESLPFPGVVAALESLRAAGARLAVCTNKPTDLSVLLLQQLGLAPLFAAIVGPDAAPAPKPDPRHLIAAVEGAGGRAARAVMVGDSASDAGAARAAAIPLVLVSFGYTEIPARELGADILIDHFDDLAGACGRLLAPCPTPAQPL